MGLGPDPRYDVSGAEKPENTGILYISYKRFRYLDPKPTSKKLSATSYYVFPDGPAMFLWD